MTAIAWVENERGALVRVGGTALLVHATWVDDAAWFYECPACQCSFGPLVDRAAAEADAVAHDEQWHNEEAVAS